jgi:hypothetical protein
MIGRFPVLAVLTVSSVYLGACRGDQASAPTPSPTGNRAVPAVSPSSAPAHHDDEDRDRPSSAGTPANVSSGLPASPRDPNGSARTWAFDTDKPDGPPAGFSFGRTGSGKPGTWVIRAEPDAPSKPSLLAQVDADRTDNRFPVAVANEPSLRDVRLSVRCKPVAGSVDQACGLVFRFRDENNYYLTRANALENNVRLYYVKDGHRKQLEGSSLAVTSKAWHELRVDAREDHFEVYWDGKKVIDGHDKTFPDAGKVGVWTKADSVTYFDDLSATSL